VLKVTKQDILSAIVELSTKVDKMSGTLDADLAALTTAVSNMTTEVAAAVKEIQDLIAAGGSAPTPDQLKRITDATVAIEAANSALAAAIPAPPQ